MPVMRDRAQQALVKLALEPEWEACFEPNSYGFRPGRSCQDAIEAIYIIINHKAKYVLDADLKGCFDNINHEALLGKLKTYPALKRVIQDWLKAGIFDNGVFDETRSGTPQGGVISPLLANIALHGMEQAMIEGYSKSHTVEKPILVRYADDFVILHSDKTELQKVADRAAKWLQDMGLQLNLSKTRITHTLDPYEENVGFDFLGFHVQQYRVGKTHTGENTHGKPLGYKALIRPSKEAIKRHTREIGQRLRKLRTAPIGKIISELNPIIRGWSNYYRWVVCSEVFATCDWNTYRQLIRWSNARQHQKGKREAGRKYHIRVDTRTRFGTYIKDKVGNPTPIYVRYHADTHSQDYVKVKGTASPYDGNLLYWAKRLKQHPLVTNEKAKLLKIQQYQCPRCGLYFKDGDLLEVDHSIPTALGGKDDLSNKWVYHRHCHDEKTAEDMAYIAKRKAEGVNHM
jgi:RNA-directed DNA polymerase